MVVPRVEFGTSDGVIYNPADGSRRQDGDFVALIAANKSQTPRSENAPNLFGGNVQYPSTGAPMPYGSNVVYIPIQDGQWVWKVLNEVGITDPAQIMKIIGYNTQLEDPDLVIAGQDVVAVKVEDLPQEVRTNLQNSGVLNSKGNTVPFADQAAADFIHYAKDIQEYGYLPGHTSQTEGPERAYQVWMYGEDGKGGLKAYLERLPLADRAAVVKAIFNDTDLTRNIRNGQTISRETATRALKVYLELVDPSNPQQVAAAKDVVEAYLKSAPVNQPRSDASDPQQISVKELLDSISKNDAISNKEAIKNIIREVASKVKDQQK